VACPRGEDDHDLWLSALGYQAGDSRRGLFGPDGVVLGLFGQDYLRHHGPEHVLCVAPTRSGKRVGLVIPTLLTWPGSAIVHDIKGENWQLTAELSDIGVRHLKKLTRASPSSTRLWRRSM